MQGLPSSSSGWMNSEGFEGFLQGFLDWYYRFFLQSSETVDQRVQVILCTFFLVSFLSLLVLIRVSWWYHGRRILDFFSPEENKEEDLHTKLQSFLSPKTSRLKATIGRTSKSDTPTVAPKKKTK
ncbi:hypothetical protein QOT17_005975 [Balamuthia mandrillaris]